MADDLFSWQGHLGPEPRDRVESERRKTEGMERAAISAPPRNAVLFWIVIERLLRERQTFTMDDFFALFDKVHSDAGLAPPTARDWTGACMSQAYKRGILARTGAFALSARPKAHSKPLPVLTGGPRAQEWLRERH